ncbi:MAG: N-acyl homoserine lactonase family protein [Gammaproteobacteria bacterium]|nr:N-acyl homoserine lactonase family protein [Gammaproteobacteria bacterium]
MTRRSAWYLLGLTAAWLLTGPIAGAQPAQDLPLPRLYVLEGGVLVSDPGSYQLREDEVASTELSIAAYLIVHRNGVLIWDTLGIADEERIPEGTGAEQTIIRSDRQERHVTLGPPLLEQLAEIGYAPSDVTHLALSHFHWDHTANANAFADATWLVHPVERDSMFSGSAGGSARPATYDQLENSETILVTADEHDVFGDGTVILKAAPGHTPGHQVLYVNLPRTGGVVLSGDLYHYPEERSLHRMPVNEERGGATGPSRQAVEAFLERKQAELWIGHDLIAHRNLNKAPAYYD